MKRLIKSIKKNPNAGKQDYFVPGIAHYEKVIRKEADKNSVLFSTADVKIPIDEREFERIAAFQDKYNKYPDNIVSVNMQRDVQHHRSLFPEHKYFITYEELKIQCRFCKAKFNYSKLKKVFDECPTCGNECYLENVCPKCKVSDCLSERVIDETVEEFKKRSANEIR